jgi:hypothetical protein
LAAVAGFTISVIGVMKVIRRWSLIIQFARAFGIAALPKPGFEEFHQPVNQPLLPAYDVETAFMTVLLENLAYVAFEISHRPPPEGFSEILLWPRTAQQTLTQDSEGWFQKNGVARTPPPPEITGFKLKGLLLDGKREIPMRVIQK